MTRSLVRFGLAFGGAVLITGAVVAFLALMAWAMEKAGPLAVVAAILVPGVTAILWFEIKYSERNHKGKGS